MYKYFCDYFSVVTYLFITDEIILETYKREL